MRFKWLGRTERRYDQLARQVGIIPPSDQPPEVQARMRQWDRRIMVWGIGGTLGAAAVLLGLKFGSNLYMSGELRPSMPKSVAIFCKVKPAPEPIINFSALRSPAAVRAAIPEGCEAQICEQNQGVLANCKSATDEEVAQLAITQVQKDERANHVGWGFGLLGLAVCAIGIIRSSLKERRYSREIRELTAKHPEEGATTPPA